MLKINEEEKLRDVVGSFNGESFIEQDGGEYPVTPNYASKSGLVEGDILRLIITKDGKFIYKQINLVDRKSLFGTIHFEKDGGYVRTINGDYKILAASISFMRVEEGDEAIIIVPRDFSAVYGSLKAIIKRNGGDKNGKEI